VIWTNLHGGFLAGILLICAYAGGELIAAAVAQRSEDRAPPHPIEAGATDWQLWAASPRASLIQYGWRLHAQLIRFLTNPAFFRISRSLHRSVFRHPLAPFFELMLLLGAADRHSGAYAEALRIGFCSSPAIPIWLCSQSEISFVYDHRRDRRLAWALTEWLRYLQQETAGSPLHRCVHGINSLSVRLTAADAGPHWHVAGPGCESWRWEP